MLLGAGLRIVGRAGQRQQRVVVAHGRLTDGAEQVPDGLPILMRARSAQHELGVPVRNRIAVDRNARGIGPAVAHLAQHGREVLTQAILDRGRLGKQADDSAHARESPLSRWSGRTYQESLFPLRKQGRQGPHDTGSGPHVAGLTPSVRTWHGACRRRIHAAIAASSCGTARLRRTRARVHDRWRISACLVALRPRARVGARSARLGVRPARCGPDPERADVSAGRPVSR